MLCCTVLQVCSRLGLDCGVKVVEDGRYCLVWPRPQPTQATQQQQQQQQQQEQQQQQQDQQVEQLAQAAAMQQQTLLSVGGDACVVDVYGEGALLPVREVRTRLSVALQHRYLPSHIPVGTLTCSCVSLGQDFHGQWQHIGWRSDLIG
jgi:hypothetical protein